MAIDEKDIRIIELLKENSRESIKNIARKTKLRPSTVHQRITKLIKNKVIERFTIKLNDEKINEEFIALMFVKTKPETNLDAKALSNPHVKEVFGITGEYDLLLKMKFKDVKEFNDYIIKFRKEQDVETTHTMVVTVNIKEEL
jgi:DNA-binding Lrp family transcriptional regulator